MAKKCIPGVICIEQTTFYMILCLIVVCAFVWYQLDPLGKSRKIKRDVSRSLIIPSKHSEHVSVTSSLATIPSQDIRGDVGRCGSSGRTIGDPLTNPYVPPIKCDSGSLMNVPLNTNMSSHSVPINIPTQHYNTQYTQIGILTKRYGTNNEILPLMGRRTVTSRDKWQYYTVSGGGAGGNLQTKLPIRIKGKQCSGEYGCNEIYSGDEVYVEGFQDTFQATIYESGLFSYIPY